MAAGSGKENIQRSDTNCWGREAVNVEDHTATICVEEEPTYSRCKTEYAQREREAQRMYLLRMQHLQ